VNNSRSGKIVHSASQEWIAVEGRDEAGGRPDGVDYDGVDEPGKHETVSQVGFELATLGNGTSNDLRQE